MPAADINDIGDAIVSSLNGADLSQAFTCQRKSWHLLDLKDNDNLVVTVVPRGEVIERISRKSWTHRYRIATVVQQKLDTDDIERTIYDLSLLVDDITEHLRDAGRMNSAQYIDSDKNPIWNSDAINDKRQFENVTEHTYSKTLDSSA